MQQLQSDNVSEEYLGMVVETLSDLISCQSYRPGLSMEAERMIILIVNKFSLRKPIHIRMPLWIEAMLVLANYGRCTLRTEFVIKAMKIEGLSVGIHIQLFQVFNQIFSNMGNLEDQYGLISVQLDRIANNRYLEEAEDQGGIEGIETCLKVVLNMLKVIGRCLTSIKNSADINEHVLAQYFKEYEFFEKCVKATLNLFEKFHYESFELPYTIIYIFEQLLELIEEEKVVGYIS